MQPCNLWCLHGRARCDKSQQSQGRHGGTQPVLMEVVGLSPAAMPRSITSTPEVCRGMLPLVGFGRVWSMQGGGGSPATGGDVPGERPPLLGAGSPPRAPGSPAGPAPPCVSRPGWSASPRHRWRGAGESRTSPASWPRPAAEHPTRPASSRWRHKRVGKRQEWEGSCWNGLKKIAISDVHTLASQPPQCWPCLLMGTAPSTGARRVLWVGSHGAEQPLPVSPVVVHDLVVQVLLVGQVPVGRQVLLVRLLVEVAQLGCGGQGETAG